MSKYTSKSPRRFLKLLPCYKLFLICLFFYLCGKLASSDLSFTWRWSQQEPENRDKHQNIMIWSNLSNNNNRVCNCYLLSFLVFNYCNNQQVIISINIWSNTYLGTHNFWAEEPTLFFPSFLYLKYNFLIQICYWQRENTIYFLLLWFWWRLSNFKY